MESEGLIRPLPRKAPKEATDQHTSSQAATFIGHHSVGAMAPLLKVPQRLRRRAPMYSLPLLLQRIQNWPGVAVGTARVEGLSV